MITDDSSVEAGAEKAKQPAEPRELIKLRVGLVTEVLGVARQDPDAFRRNQQEWLGKNLGLLDVLLKDLFKKTITRFGITEAEAVFIGGIMGAGIVRTAVEEGATTTDECMANLMTWGVDQRGVMHDEVAAKDDKLLLNMYGPEVANEFGQVQHASARTTSAFIAGLCLSPQPVE